MGKRGLAALLSLFYWCLVIVVWLFLVVPWVCLQFVIVEFPDHTYLLFWYQLNAFKLPGGLGCCTIRSKAVVQLLLIVFLFLLSLFVGILCLVLVLLLSNLCLSNFATILLGKRGLVS